MSKHTPGPWACVSGARKGEFTVYLPTDGMLICSRNEYDDKHAEMLANARLIAAAPDLLKATMWARDDLKAAGFDATVILLDEAIAKAKGDKA